MERMYACLFYVFLFFTLVTDATYPPRYHLLSLRHKPELAFHFETRYFPQNLDHFSFQPESYTGNEADIEWFGSNTGFMTDIAPKFQALLEHGKSSKPHRPDKTLGYLNSHQALASEASPVGSYGGMLAAWFRLKYPHIAIGALASSPPILQFDKIVPSSSFYDAVSQDFKLTTTLSEMRLKLYALFQAKSLWMIIVFIIIALQTQTSISTRMHKKHPVKTILGYIRKLLIFSIIALSIMPSTAHFDGLHKELPVETIQSSDGDIIDCFHAIHQPAFEHPLLKNHKIQKPPSRLSKMGEKRIWQVWNQNGSKCPDTTIPIRRSSGAKYMGKKQWRETPTYTADQGHEYAIGYAKYPNGIYGTQATMSVWSPAVEKGGNEFSLSQIWLIAGHYDGLDLNTIEVGWEVYPDYYHDSQPRLFIFWTRDTYTDTRCYNLDCPGFIQTSSDYVIGGAFSPISSYDGDQFDVTMLVWKDTDTGNWWLAIGHSVVGYWPSSLFTHLAEGPAWFVQWGGEIVNNHVSGHHTTGQMGSGHFAEEGLRKAAFTRNILVIDYLYHRVEVDFDVHSTFPKCYDAVKGHSAEWGSYFYYGGPGFSALCP